MSDNVKDMLNLPNIEAILKRFLNEILVIRAVWRNLSIPHFPHDKFAEKNLTWHQCVLHETSISAKVIAKSCCFIPDLFGEFKCNMYAKNFATGHIYRAQVIYNTHVIKFTQGVGIKVYKAAYK